MPLACKRRRHPVRSPDGRRPRFWRRANSPLPPKAKTATAPTPAPLEIERSLSYERLIALDYANTDGASEFFAVDASSTGRRSAKRRQWRFTEGLTVAADAEFLLDVNQCAVAACGRRVLTWERSRAPRRSSSWRVK